MGLTKTFAPDTYARGLESWSWLRLQGKTPIQATLFGDVFLQDADGFWFLDSIEGSLKKVAASRDELLAILNSPEGQDQFLLGGLAMAAEQKGRRLSEKEVYDFTVPPVLGGRIELDNITVLDFVVSLNLAGQLHDQVRNMPPGTKIKGVEIKP
jgi:Domain of unknown function (DUF1851)